MNKILLLIATTIFASVGMAAELSQCSDPSSSEVSYESESMRIIFTTGNNARQIYESLNVAEEAPKAGTFSDDYIQKAIIDAKYTKNANCWKVQAPTYTNGQYTGVSDCLSFSCNLIERF